MLSLHVLESEVQLKLTTPMALQPSLEHTLSSLLLLFVFPLHFSLTFFTSAHPLLLSCQNASLLSPRLWFESLSFASSSFPTCIFQPSPNTRVSAFLCSLVFFLYRHIAIHLLWAHRFSFASHAANSFAGNFRTPISACCSFPHLIHSQCHVEAISRPHLFHLKHIW